MRDSTVWEEKYHVTLIKIENMASVVPGYTTEQKSVTVANNDGAMNAEIATQGADNWIVVSLTLFNSDASVIILFTRTVLTALS